MQRLVLTMQETADFVRNTTSAGRICQLSVTGYSMSPTLKPGRDSVFLAAAAKKELKKGDIVFYERNPQSYVLHRIVKRKKDGSYGINGDGQVQIEWVRQEKILAVVTELERKGKRIPVEKPVYRAYVWIWIRMRRFRNVFLRGKQMLTRRECV